MTTMKTLATAMGVSVTTVSNAYNHPDRLSADLRQRILAKGEELGYSGPNAAGRLLRSGRAHAIGAICGSGYSYAFDDPYALSVFRVLSKEFERASVALSMLPTGADESNVAAVASAVVDAIVCISSYTTSPAVELARRRGIPVVFSHIVEGGDYVAIDDTEAGTMVARHIADLGHQRVAIVYQHEELPEPKLSSGHDLEAIATEFDKDGNFMGPRLRAMAAPFDPDQLLMVAVHASSGGTGADGLDALLELDEPPTAVMASMDRIALSVLDEIERLGLEPGVDISLASIDGVPEAMERKLTTVHQPMDQRGLMLAKLALDPELADRQVLLPITFHPGVTTGAPADVRASVARAARKRAKAGAPA